MWIDSHKYLDEIKDTFDSKGNASPVVRKYSKYGMLLIDDFGAENKTEWAMSEMFKLINNRINNMKITIVTSNLSLDQVSSYNERLASRFSSFCVKEITGKDRRVK